MKVFVTLYHDDLKMMRTMRTYQERHQRSPKKREIIRCLNDDFRGTRGRKTFARLVLLEVITHSRNGHCWLTDKGEQALLAA